MTAIASSGTRPFRRAPPAIEGSALLRPRVLALVTIGVLATVIMWWPHAAKPSRPPAPVLTELQSLPDTEVESRLVAYWMWKAKDASPGTWRYFPEPVRHVVAIGTYGGLLASSRLMPLCLVQSADPRGVDLRAMSDAYQAIGAPGVAEVIKKMEAIAETNVPLIEAWRIYVAGKGEMPRINPFADLERKAAGEQQKIRVQQLFDAYIRIHLADLVGS